MDIMMKASNKQEYAAVQEVVAYADECSRSPKLWLAFVCQTASKTDPGSASNFDPLM